MRMKNSLNSFSRQSANQLLVFHGVHMQSSLRIDFMWKFCGSHDSVAPLWVQVVVGWRWRGMREQWPWWWGHTHGFQSSRAQNFRRIKWLNVCQRRFPGWFQGNGCVRRRSVGLRFFLFLRLGTNLSVVLCVAFLLRVHAKGHDNKSHQQNCDTRR